MSIFVGLLAVLLTTVVAQDESFHEELLFTPLATNDIVSHFRFTTLVPSTSAPFGRHFDLLSRFVGELRDAHDLEEFSVSLARGVWNEERWGYSPESVPPGAEVSAWFGAGVAEAMMSGMMDGVNGGGERRIGSTVVVTFAVEQ